MPLLYNKLLLAACVTLCAFLPVNAQNINGSLGDPVFKETFGSSLNPIQPLASSVTSLTYYSGKCVPDGGYALVNSMNVNLVCNPVAWHQVKTDHTGNVGGLMMMIDAAVKPGYFYNQKISSLCPGTTYQFSVYILNLGTVPYSKGANQPDMTFSAETVNGTLVGSPTRTGIVGSAISPTWVQFLMTFTTPAAGGDIVIKMKSNAPGGPGNDFLLDDITITPYAPIIKIGFDSQMAATEQSVCAGSDAMFTLSSSQSPYANARYQWQVYDKTGVWTDVAGANAASFVKVYTNVVAGLYKYRLSIWAQNASATCRVYSATASVVVYALPSPKITAPQIVCEGEPFTLTGSGGVSYKWTGPNISAATQNPLVINSAVIADGGVYTLTATSAQGCSSTTKVTVNFVKKTVANAGSAKTVYKGQPIKLNGTVKNDVSAVYWTPTDYLDNPNSLTPIAHPIKDTRYTLHTVSAYDCGTDTSSVVVKVYTKISIPDAFSPNNDGINDVWNITELAYYPNCTVTVFNRYGQQVFISNGYGRQWDGAFKGAPLAAGTYYYTIDLKNDTPKLTGWVVLIL
jgi:gliding motility-associated-like protein